MRKFFAAVMFFAVVCAVQAWALPVRVITTGDMHGWIMGQDSEDGIIGGTAEMLAYWKKYEGYKPEKFLLISAGDNVTGPDISTAFKGDPAITVMNLMRYDVSAVGNHEFDYSADKLREWVKMADFPYIVSNLVNQDYSQVDFAVPFIMNIEQGVKVAVIGLTTSDLHSSTNNAKEFRLLPYVEALRRTVDRAKNAGAEMIVVAAHVPQDELIVLAEEVKDLQIPLIIGGHSHEMAQRKVGDTWVVNSGCWWDYYTRVDLDYNPESGRSIVLSSKQVFLAQQKPKTERSVKKEVGKWKNKMDKEFGAVVGHTNTGLVRIPDLYNFVADTYANFDITADFALLNHGSLRQDWQAGEINKGTVLSLMPFTNTLLKVQVNGANLEQLVLAGELGISGLKVQGDTVIMSKSNTTLNADKIYSVIMPNFIYETTELLFVSDPNPEKISDDWREPVYTWLERNPTSKEKPLESVIDSAPRN